MLLHVADSSAQNEDLWSLREILNNVTKNGFATDVKTVYLYTEYLVSGLTHFPSRSLKDSIYHRSRRIEEHADCVIFQQKQGHLNPPRGTIIDRAVLYSFLNQTETVWSYMARKVRNFFLRRSPHGSQELANAWMHHTEDTWQSALIAAHSRNRDFSEEEPPPGASIDFGWVPFQESGYLALRQFL